VIINPFFYINITVTVILSVCPVLISIGKEIDEIGDVILFVCPVLISIGKEIDEIGDGYRLFLRK
jgi:hypothetical protein